MRQLFTPKRVFEFEWVRAHYIRKKKKSGLGNVLLARIELGTH